VHKTVERSRFSLLAQSVTGRRTQVIDGDREIAYSDGQSIFLPRGPEEYRRAGVLAQAGLVAIGSFDRHLMARLSGHSGVTERYLLLECVRAATILRPVFPHTMSQSIAAIYCGPVPADANQSLNWARQSHLSLPDPPKWLGAIKPISVLRTAGESDRDARPGWDKVATSSRDALPDIDDAEDSERVRFLELFSAPIQTPLSSMINRFFGMGRAPATDGQGGGDLATGTHGTGSVSSNGRRTDAPDTLTPGSAKSYSGYRYPEWDHVRGRYRPRWCTVAEFDPPPLAGKNPVPERDWPVRRELSRLGLTHERHRRQPQGDALDLTALIDAAVARVAGVDVDTRVYECRRRTAHDLSVLILLDATGSTRTSSTGHRVFDQQRDLVARLTAALDHLGDRVATYGFSSEGRNAVQFVRVKEFGDRYDHAARQRLAALSPRGFTRLGAAVRHGTHLLDTRAGTAKKLLILVGDGFPYDTGYEGRYAESDSRQALSEAVTRGVGCACISVGTAPNIAVNKRVWGAVSHRHLDTPSELAPVLRDLFATALRTAAATKRSIGTTGHGRSAVMGEDC
jgi:Mg-chelatase subunit ChlD